MTGPAQPEGDWHGPLPELPPKWAPVDPQAPLGSPEAAGHTLAGDAQTPAQAARTAWNAHWAGPDPYPAGQTQEQTFEAVWGKVAKAVSDCFPLATEAVRERDEARGQLAREDPRGTGGNPVNVQPQAPMSEPEPAGHALHASCDARIASLDRDRAHLDGECNRVSAECNEYAAQVSELGARLANTQGHRERLVREAATMTRELNRLTAELATCRERNAAIAAQSDEYRDERDDARDQLATMEADYQALQATQDRQWARCPDGCGCRLNSDDADKRECGCDGPCCMECRENGYPDAPSYRDLAVAEVNAASTRQEAEITLQLTKAISERNQAILHVSRLLAVIDRHGTSALTETLAVKAARQADAAAPEEACDDA